MAFYYPWSTSNEKELVVPLDGAVELCYEEVRRPYALDLNVSALGDLDIVGTNYNEAYVTLDGVEQHLVFHRELEARELYDGIIVLRPLREFRGATLIEDWLETPGMRDHLVNGKYYGRTFTDGGFYRDVMKDCDIQDRLSRLMVKEWRGYFK